MKSGREKGIRVMELKGGVGEERKGERRKRGEEGKKGTKGWRGYKTGGKGRGRKVEEER